MPAIAMPSMRHERVALHDHAVREGAAVALVGVADDVFLLGGGLRDGAPLDAGRKAGAAAAAQARLRDLFHDGFGAERQCALKALEAAMGAIILDRKRIDDPAAGEGQPGLALEPGQVVDDAEPERMRPTVGQDGIQHCTGIGRRHRTVAHAARGRCDLDQRFEPIQPPRTVADDLQ